MIVNLGHHATDSITQNNLFLRNGRAPVLRRSLVVAFRFENGPPLCRRLRNGGPQLDKGSGCQSGHGYGYLRKLVSATPCPCLNAYCYCVKGFLKIHSQMRLPPNICLFIYLFPRGPSAPPHHPRQIRRDATATATFCSLAHHNAPRGKSLASSKPLSLAQCPLCAYYVAPGRASYRVQGHGLGLTDEKKRA